MTAASTHDTKRGEDVRARIAVLAEVPDLWAGALDRLLDARPGARPRLRQPALAGGRRRLVRRPRPARPAPRVRREGDARGRRPDHVDRARRRPTRRPCTPRSTRPSTTRASAPCSTRCCSPSPTPAGRNALPPSWSGSPSPASRTSTRAPSSGEQSLVDPDNRRPVDFAAPRRLLARTDPSTPSCAWCARRCDCVATGPSCSRRTTRSTASGEAADHVLAFDRGGARHRRHPAARSAWPPAAAGATPPLAPPRRSLARRADRRRRRPATARSPWPTC